MPKHPEAPGKRPGGPVRPPSLRRTVRLGKAVDIWRKPAFSAAFSLAVPNLSLLAADRLDLALYTSAGAMCALYGHGLPYAARARALFWVVLGMVAGLGLALTAACWTRSAPVLVLLAALLAAVHKVVCDATRIGPPGNLIFTFIAASAFFVPQRPAEVPGHLLLAAACGAFAWLVCMAPAAVRPHGPERIAVARALEAAAGLLRAPADAGARHATAAAVNAAWHTLRSAPRRTGARPGRRPGAAGRGSAARVRTGLARLLVRAESALAAEVGDPAAEAERYTGWARDLRSGRPLPRVALTAAQAAELAGVAVERAGSAPSASPAPRQGPGRRARAGARRIAAAFAPGSPLLPVGARVAAGCALAGWVSIAAGVSRPYWAVVTAASIHQANTSLSWQRAVQRTLGNLLGLVVFAALLPVVHTGAAAMVLLVLACQIGAEALITRNYWLGSVCVTPMALLLTEFGGSHPAGELIGARWTDTLLGAGLGLLACCVITNRRATGRAEAALRAAEDAMAEARRTLAAPAPEPAAGPGAGPVGDRLRTSLVELREAVEVASGEWWQPAGTQERAAAAEREGHRLLAQLVRRRPADRRAAEWG
ncbi:FUSC family protein [Streptomyces pactum]|uniref:FUSC family protein n=1 Tax=Streptomyces pactum TaxID=68249 RepID=A0ABS0NFA6_9ACTN|nr:FUSC family protein [Streptomyces pactum]MBH5333814.1 FUSC family protein [Streptomyces pactum]